ncbi:lysylphosphatidylglycerol synthase transmembrane domain-containing protein [Protaetiibacter intestinalis]|nr:YbhN family protein [Protaetiibacter intestinalis]
MTPPADDETSPAVEPGAAARRERLRRIGAVVLQSAIVLALALALALWLQRDWDTVAATFATISPWSLVAATLSAMAGVVASAFVWRGVLGALGQPSTVVSALVVYLVGQLAKFIPGGFWAFLYQIVLGARRGFGRVATGLAGPIAAAVGLATGGITLSLALSRIAVPLPWLYPLIGTALLLVTLVSPALVNGVVRWGLRVVLRRGDREVSFTRPLIAQIIACALASWFLYGAQLLFLLSGTSHTMTILGATAIAAGAQSLGFLAVIFPSGLGVREAVIVAGLSGFASSPSAALAIALAARVTSTIGDLLAAGLSRLAEWLATRRSHQLG